MPTTKSTTHRVTKLKNSRPTTGWQSLPTELRQQIILDTLLQLLKLKNDDLVRGLQNKLEWARRSFSTDDLPYPIQCFLKVLLAHKDKLETTRKALVVLHESFVEEMYPKLPSDRRAHDDFRHDERLLWETQMEHRRTQDVVDYAILDVLEPFLAGESRWSKWQQPRMWPRRCCGCVVGNSAECVKEWAQESDDEGDKGEEDDEDDEEGVEESVFEDGNVAELTDGSDDERWFM